jgi:hypothetical protein
MSVQAESQSQSHVTTDDQSVSKSWIRAPQQIIRLCSLGSDHKENTSIVVSLERTPKKTSRPQFFNC